MTTAVLVLSVDEAGLLRHSLPLAAAQPGVSLWVIDNACTDETAAVASACGARVVAMPSRLSYAAAMNRGLAVVLATGAESVLLLNADCFLVPGSLAFGVAALRDGVGSVTPKLLRAASPPADPAAGVQPWEAIDAAGMSLDRRRKNGLVGHGRSALLYTRAAPAFGADGACALYRADVLRAAAVGEEVFDEDMGLWASDADLAWRAASLGWTCVFEPRFLGRHLRTYSPSTRRATSAAHRRLQFRNRLLMVAKNETAAGLRADGAQLLAYEIAALGYAVLREPRALLPGYAEFAARLAAALARRHPTRARPPFGLEPPP